MRFNSNCIAVMIFLGFTEDRLYNRYINGISTPNASDSITNGFLMKRSIEKYPKTLKTRKYKPRYALKVAARELQMSANERVLGEFQKWWKVDQTFRKVPPRPS